MTSNKLQYFSQNDFSKGIETRQEMLGKGQVLDAQNMWAFLGECGQRPGTCARVYSIGFFGSPVVSPVTVILNDKSAGTDSIITLAVTNLNAVEYGDTITFQYSSASTTITQGGFFAVTTAVPTNLVTKTRLTLEFWTSRGWVPAYTESTLAAGVPPVLQPFYFAQYLVAVVPSDIVTTTKTFTTGSYTGYFARIHIVSSGTTVGVPFTAGTVPNASCGQINCLSNQVVNQVNTAEVVRAVGSYFLKFNAGNLNTTIYTTPRITGSSFTSLPAAVLKTGTVPLAATSVDSVGTKYSTGFTAAALPPTVAVIPEFNTAFVTFSNFVFEIPYLETRTQIDDYGTGTATGPLTARVNTNPLIVGPISVATPAVPYSTDLVPQLSAFPAANLIVYFKDRLWAAGILGSPNLLRWSGSATDGAYNVWPEQSEVPLSTAKDNSEITAIVPLGDNLVVFKKNSIWQMVDNGISDTGPQLALYEPRLVVAGVGTVSHASVQAVNGGLIFLAEDGFYFYDGTPNIKRLSDSIKDYVDDLSPARTPFAVSTVWRTKLVYLCAASTQGETNSNDRIFVFDFQNGGWWIWSGLDVQCWYQQDGVGLKEELYALDGTGRAYQLERWTQTDNGANIDSYVTTARIGFTDLIAKAATDVRVRGINNNPTITLDVIADDFTVLSGAQIVMPKDTEAQYADNVPYTTSTYAPTRRRERKHSIREPGAWFQLKLHKMMKLFGFDLGFNEEGRR